MDEISKKEKKTQQHFHSFPFHSSPHIATSTPDLSQQPFDSERWQNTIPSSNPLELERISHIQNDNSFAPEQIHVPDQNKEDNVSGQFRTNNPIDGGQLHLTTPQPNKSDKIHRTLIATFSPLKKHWIPSLTHPAPTNPQSEGTISFAFDEEDEPYNFDTTAASVIETLPLQHRRLFPIQNNNEKECGDQFHRDFPDITKNTLNFMIFSRFVS